MPSSRSQKRSAESGGEKKTIQALQKTNSRDGQGQPRSANGGSRQKVPHGCKSLNKRPTSPSSGTKSGLRSGDRVASAPLSSRCKNDTYTNTPTGNTQTNNTKPPKANGNHAGKSDSHGSVSCSAAAFGVKPPARGCAGTNTNSTIAQGSTSAATAGFNGSRGASPQGSCLGSINSAQFGKAAGKSGKNEPNKPSFQIPPVLSKVNSELGPITKSSAYKRFGPTSFEEANPFLPNPYAELSESANNEVRHCSGSRPGSNVSTATCDSQLASSDKERAESTDSAGVAGKSTPTRGDGSRSSARPQKKSASSHGATATTCGSNSKPERDERRSASVNGDDRKRNFLKNANEKKQSNRGAYLEKGTSSPQSPGQDDEDDEEDERGTPQAVRTVEGSTDHPQTINEVMKRLHQASMVNVARHVEPKDLIQYLNQAGYFGYDYSVHERTTTDNYNLRYGQKKGIERLYVWLSMHNPGEDCCSSDS